MEELLSVDNEKMKIGIEEMLKGGINMILSYGGPFTLAIAIDNYTGIRKIADKFGVNTSQYDNKFYQFKKELGII